MTPRVGVRRSSEAQRSQPATPRVARYRSTATLRAALHAEWTKLRTSPGTGWLLAAVVGTTVAVSVLASAAITSCPAHGCGVDPAKLSLTGVQLGQAVVVILAVLGIGTEYSTGLIRITLTAVPRRSTMLLAKAIVLGGVVLATAAVAVPAALLVGWQLLPNGLFPANYPDPVSLGDPAVLRAAVGSVLYLALIALLSLGVATIVRNSAAAIGAVLGLLYLLPILTLATSDEDWQRRFDQLSPTSAGLAVQATIGLEELPIGPWPGLAVLAGWAAGAMLIGGLLLRRRDA